MERAHHHHLFPYRAIIVFSLIVLALFLAGHYYFTTEKKQISIDQQNQVAALTGIKVGQISAWLMERKAEGIFLASHPDFIRLMKSLTTNPQQEQIREEISRWLATIIKNHGYKEILIYNHKGDPLLLINDSGYSVTGGIPAMKMTDGIFPDSITCLEHCSGGSLPKFSLEFVVPVKDNLKPVALVVLRMDAEIYFSSIFKEWPYQTSSGESLLSWMTSDSVQYLFGSSGRIKVQSSHRKSEMDALSRKVMESGTMAMIEAADYRGVDVMANSRQVPGTSWKMISKIDTDEIYAPMKRKAVSVIVYLAGMLAVVFISLALIWKNQQVVHFRKQLEYKSMNIKAEERIRFMNALLEEVNDAIITFDKDLIIQSWNKGAEKIYGWKSEEVVGKFGGGSLRVDFPGSTRESVFRELDEKGFWKGEVVHKRKDGSTAYLLSSTSHLKDEAGNVLGIITINKDISEVVQSEKVKNAVYRISELAITSRTLDEMYAAIHVVIGELMDARNLFIALREGLDLISFPYFVDEKDSKPEPQVMGNGLTEYVIRTGKPLLAKPEDIAYFTNREIIDMVGPVAIDWIGIPLKIEKETIGVLVVQSYDPAIRYGDREKDILVFVSEQIALSIHRKKIQQELIEAKQKAEVSNKLTSALLSNMNHELRTPMNGILGFAEILMHELKDEDSRSKAENILVSGRRLMDTLDAIMDLSYLQSHEVARKFQPVFVGPILSKVLKNYEQPLRRKHLKLHLDIQENLAILGDEHLFQHLLRNLVDNAVKYTDQGSITIKAALAAQDDKQQVVLTIKDTGMGISKENYAMIFEAFRQVSEGYGRKFEGSGLGLTISKRILELLNGEISLVSDVGQGSEFTILLPSAQTVPVEVPSAGIDIPRPEVAVTGPHKLPDVLIVEDNLVNIQLLMIYIKDLCNIYTTLDAKSAIQLTRERKFDAILMDINLGPGLDGIQAMLEIRKRPDYQDVPILAVTGYASIGDRERLLSLGFNGYLPKPYDREAIAVALQGIFG